MQTRRKSLPNAYLIKGCCPEPGSLALQADSLPSELPGKPQNTLRTLSNKTSDDQIKKWASSLFLWVREGEHRPTFSSLFLTLASRTEESSWREKYDKDLNKHLIKGGILMANNHMNRYIMFHWGECKLKQ